MKLKLKASIKPILKPTTLWLNKYEVLITLWSYFESDGAIVNSLIYCPSPLSPSQSVFTAVSHSPTQS